jgi:hypothetical protein
MVMTNQSSLTILTEAHCAAKALWEKKTGGDERGRQVGFIQFRKETRTHYALEKGIRLFLQGIKGPISDQTSTVKKQTRRTHRLCINMKREYAKTSLLSVLNNI